MESKVEMPLELRNIYIYFHCWMLIVNFLISFHLSFLNSDYSAKLIDIYRNRHNISASSGLNDPAVATGIADLIYELEEAQTEPDSIDPDLAMAWAAGLEGDSWENNAPAMTRVRYLSNLVP